MRSKELISLLASVCLVLSLAALANAADRKRTSIKEGRLTGTIHRVNKDASTIIIRTGADQRKVVYNAETKFTFQNKPGASLDDVIVGRRATCLGTFDDKTQLTATRVDVRTK
jgi:hypothetical protein